MTPEEVQRRYVRKPKPESKVTLSPKRKYRVYRSDGSYMGTYRVGGTKKKWYEDRGFRFEPVWK